MTDAGTPDTGVSGGRESAVTGVDRRDGTVVVSLAGELDLYNAEEVRSALLDACAAEPAALVVDLEEVRFIDSTALGVLIEANRIDQRVAAYETWDDLKHYCVHSADPCGRLVLGVVRRLDDAELVAASDSVCTGLQLVNFLQDVPRDLELGRVYLPAEDLRRFGAPALDRPSDELRELLRFEAERAAVLLRAGDLLRVRIGGRLGRAVGLFARGGLAALEALEAASWDVFTQRPKPSRARLAREAALVLVR